MPRKLGVPTFPLGKNGWAEEGRKIVHMGEYVGESEGKMGVNFNFMELEKNPDSPNDDPSHVVLSGGALRWRAEQGHLIKGHVYDITYKGKTEVQKGQWAGKEAHDFELAAYEPHELPESFRMSKGFEAQAQASAAAAAGPTATASESMDDLQ